jgi:hypothetical protein
MRHSDIVPEHECDGELIELPPTPTHIQRAWCSVCGAEFSYQPDSDWVFIVLPGMRSVIE